MNAEKGVRYYVIKVGCCGYPVSMSKYYETFCLVELNSTFYQYPRISTVTKWRREAPEKFEFTVKANQEVSHNYRLKINLAAQAFERMKKICRVLKAHVLLIQTPASFRPNSLEDAEAFLRRMGREDLTIVWETRGPLWENDEVRKSLEETLKELDIPHVTDPLRLMPVYTDGVAYFRLHGLGASMYYYQYTDEELRWLCDLVKPFEKLSEEVYVLFNNLSMFEDATRFKFLLQYGRFPSLTGAVGLESVKTAMGTTRYPAAKNLLMKKLGWRLVEMENGKQIRISELLKDLPPKTYKNVDEILQEMKRASVIF